MFHFHVVVEIKRIASLSAYTGAYAA